MFDELRTFFYMLSEENVSCDQRTCDKVIDELWKVEFQFDELKKHIAKLEERLEKVEE